MTPDHDNIGKLKAAIADYKSGQDGASDNLYRLLEGVLANAARTFANKNLAQAIAPGELKHIHASASPGSLGHFKRSIDRQKYAELKTGIFMWLLERFRQEPIPDNPYAWAKAVAFNRCRDLANREKADFKRFPPKPVRQKKSGDPVNDIVETAADPHAWKPDGVSLAEPPAMKGIRDMSPEEIGDLYRRIFKTEEFKRSVDTSVEFVFFFFSLIRPKRYWHEYPEAWTELQKIERLRRKSSVLEKQFKRYSTWERMIKNRIEVELPDNQEGQKFDRLLDKIQDLEEKFLNRYGTGEHSDNEFLNCLDGDTFLYNRQPWPSIALDIWSVNVSPLRMLWDIWTLTDEVKRRQGGLQNSRLKIAFLFWSQKKLTEGSDRGLLFEKLQDDANLENLRKYQYRPMGKGKRAAAYDWLIRAIHKRCFVENWTFNDDYGKDPYGAHLSHAGIAAAESMRRRNLQRKRGGDRNKTTVVYAVEQPGPRLGGTSRSR